MLEGICGRQFCHCPVAEAVPGGELTWKLMYPAKRSEIQVWYWTWVKLRSLSIPASLACGTAREWIRMRSSCAAAVLVKTHGSDVLAIEVVQDV
jgi:hypothetical protein